MAKHVGIVACSPPGASLCFEILSTEASALASSAPSRFEISMHSHTLADYMRAINAGEWSGVAELMLSSARKLAALGAEFLIAPCNTIHQAYDLVAAKSPLPWLHIGEEVARAAQRGGYRRLALLGTQFITEGEIYRSWLRRYGIEACVPESSERERLNQAIFEEMVCGRFTKPTRQYVLDLLSKMKAQGCLAAGLCCTELPLLLKGTEPPLPLLDSTEILSRAALDVLAGKRCLSTDYNPIEFLRDRESCH